MTTRTPSTSAGGWQYFHPLRPNLNWRVNTDLSVRDHAHERFDQLYVSAQTGPQFLMGPLDLSLLAEAGHNRRANRPESDEVGLRMESAWYLNSRLSLRPHARWVQRTYREVIDGDGPRWGVGARAVFQAIPELTVHAGWRYDRERPEREDYRNVRQGVDVGGSFDLPLGITAALSASFSRTVFEPHWGFLARGEAERKDRQQSLRLSLHHRGWTLRGFAPRLAVVREIRDSNAQLQSYRRWHGEVTFVRQF